MMLENLFDLILKFLTELQHSGQGGTGVKKEQSVEQNRDTEQQLCSGALAALHVSTLATQTKV